MGNVDPSLKIVKQILSFRQIMSYVFVGGGVLTLLVGFAVVVWGSARAGEATIEFGGLVISAKQLGAVVMVTSFAWGFLAYQMRTTLDLDLRVLTGSTANNTAQFETQRYLPQNMRRMQSREVSIGTVRAISLIGKMWINGSTILVSFIGGTEKQHEAVAKWSSEWTEFANINFQFGGQSAGNIRVSFDQSGGSWSYQGTDAESVPIDTPTMNLADTRKQTVLRMFGIALGLSYEHMPLGDKQVWNVEAIVQDLSGPPSYLEPDFVRKIIIAELSTLQINGLEYDPDSIMVRPIPPHWTTNNTGVQANESLSENDKKVIASEPAYPGRT